MQQKVYHAKSLAKPFEFAKILTESNAAQILSIQSTFRIVFVSVETLETQIIERTLTNDLKMMCL